MNSLSAEDLYPGPLTANTRSAINTSAIGMPMYGLRYPAQKIRTGIIRNDIQRI